MDNPGLWERDQPLIELGFRRFVSDLGGTMKTTRTSKEKWTAMRNAYRSRDVTDGQPYMRVLLLGVCGRRRRPWPLIRHLEMSVKRERKLNLYTGYRDLSCPGELLDTDLPAGAFIRFCDY